MAQQPMMVKAYSAHLSVRNLMHQGGHAPTYCPCWRMLNFSDRARTGALSIRRSGLGKMYDREWNMRHTLLRAFDRKIRIQAIQKISP
ncbi:hypothetical protein TNCV_2267501 [Trichonephila clavipes]|nr:hypothetical protein TNCV_2267501 [Trichonephila clavipes]